MRLVKTTQDFERLQTLSKFLSHKKSKDKLRYRNIAAKAGIARCSVSKIINGKQDITFTTLLKVIDAMGIEITFKEKAQ